MDEAVIVPQGYFWKMQGLEADRPEGIGTADLYLDGAISLGNPIVDEDWVTIQGRLEMTIQRRQEAAIWIRGGSLVAVGDSRQDVEFLEFTYSSAGGPGTAKLTSMVDFVDYVFWLKERVKDEKYEIYGQRPIPAIVMLTIEEEMNTRWGHVARFKAKRETLEITLNK